MHNTFSEIYNMIKLPLQLQYYTETSYLNYNRQPSLLALNIHTIKFTPAIYTKPI